jgi:hypothetical protein
MKSEPNGFPKWKERDMPENTQVCLVENILHFLDHYPYFSSNYQVLEIKIVGCKKGFARILFSWVCPFS